MAKDCAGRHVIMDLFSRFYNMKMAVVDLDDGSARVLPLPEDILVENIGGAAVNRVLLEQYRREAPLVLGVGPLTGSFAPASCLMVATFRRLESGDLCHTPIFLQAGPKLKFSGIDFMVIKGVSSQPQSLLVGGNTTIELLPAGDVLGMSVPEASEVLRWQGSASDRFIILTGPAADHNVPCAVISTGMGGSLDKCGMASWMSSRNLKAIMLNGAGGLPFAENNLVVGKKLKAAIAAEQQPITKGCLSILEKMEPPVTVMRLLAKSITKHMACYNCPFPCISYIQLPDLARPSQGKKEGFVLLDHSGFLALARKRGTESLVLMKECLNLGLDPAAVASVLPSEGKIEDAIEFVKRLAGVSDSQDRVKEPKDDQQLDRLLRGAIMPEHYRLFSGGIPPIVPDNAGSGVGSWERRVAVGMVLGICPLMILLFPKLDTVELLRFISVDAQNVEFLQERLTASVDSLLSS
jgi:aldehyde:ferredoxin oxidoreductase